MRNGTHSEGAERRKGTVSQGTHLNGAERTNRTDLNETDGQNSKVVCSKPMYSSSLLLTRSHTNHSPASHTKCSPSETKCSQAPMSSTVEFCRLPEQQQQQQQQEHQQKHGLQQNMDMDGTFQKTVPMAISSKKDNFSLNGGNFSMHEDNNNANSKPCLKLLSATLVNTTKGDSKHFREDHNCDRKSGCDQNRDYTTSGISSRHKTMVDEDKRLSIHSASVFDSNEDLLDIRDNEEEEGLSWKEFFGKSHLKMKLKN